MLLFQTFLIGAVRAILQDERSWGPDAHQFRPERFLDYPSLRNSNAFVPFGVGPRICVGRYLAESESRLIVANFIRRFAFEPFDGKPIPYADRALQSILKQFDTSDVVFFFLGLLVQKHNKQQIHQCRTS